MKILLLNPPFRFKLSRDSRWPELTKSGTLYYPYWLAYSTGVLMKQSDHEPLLIDAIANGWGFERTIDKIERFDPSLVVIETTTPTIRNDVEFVKKLKERIGAKVCLVGTHVSALPEETLKEWEAIDFVARMEYDYIIRDLADVLEDKMKLGDVLGISFKKGSKIVHKPVRPLIRNLDFLPFVSKVYKKFLDIRKYRYALARHPMAQIWSCFDKKTEILTKNGWKMFKDLTINDEVATLNPETEEIEYQRPSQIFVYDYSGKMHEIKSKQIDLLITPNHKIYCSKFSRNYEKKFKLIEVEKIENETNIEFKKDGIWKGNCKKYFSLPQVNLGPNPVWETKIKKRKKFPMDDFLSFLGYYLAEGSCTKKSNNRWIIKIAQHEESKIFKKIESCIKKLGFRYTIVKTNGKKVGFEISNKQLFLYLNQFGKAHEKYVPQDIKQLCPRQLKILLNALLESDGNLYKKTWTLYSSSKRLIDDVQEILLKIGLTGNIRISSKKGTPIRGGKYRTNYTVYRIIVNHFVTPRINYGDRNHIRKVYYSGKIYCCEVPNGIIYIRRNGKPCWSGNSRGCPNLCTFCQYPQIFSGRLYRVRSPENFVDELEWIKDNLPVKEVFVEDDTFTINKKRVIEICRLIKERGLDIVWSCNARADVPYEVLKEMKKAGCRILIVGYESGVQEILDNVKKGIILGQMKKFTINAKKLGLRIFGCFMIGLPGDTKKTIEQTFQFARKLNPDMVFFQQAVPFPGTEFYEWCKRNGYLVAKNWDDWLDENGRLASIVSYPNLTNEEIKKFRDRMMIKFYSSPKNLAKTFLRNLHPDEIGRVINAAKDYLFYMIKRKWNIK